MRVHYFFTSSNTVSELYKNAVVQFSLLDPNGKLIAEGKSTLFKHFCIQDGIPNMKAEKLFRRVVLHNSKLENFNIDVIFSEFYFA